MERRPIIEITTYAYPDDILYVCASDGPYIGVGFLARSGVDPVEVYGTVAREHLASMIEW